jgi:group I intron endonuclease
MTNYENRIGYIYKIVSPNGKIYIGQTINIKNRISKYKHNLFKGQIKLWNDCCKYEWNPSERLEIIEECLCGNNKDILNEKEIYWIEFFNSYVEGLNSNKGGNGNLGHIPSKETKEKLKIQNTGKRHKKETKEKISKFNLGKIISEETILKIKKSKKENPYRHTEESKKKISESQLGNKKRINKKHTKEAKDKISNTKKGVKNILLSKPIFCLTNGEIYESQIEAAQKLNLNQRHISSVCLGKRKSHGGYKFIFLSDYEKEDKNTSI